MSVNPSQVEYSSRYYNLQAPRCHALTLVADDVEHQEAAESVAHRRRVLFGSKNSVIRHYRRLERFIFVADTQLIERNLLRSIEAEKSTAAKDH